MPRIGINALFLIPGGVGGTEIYLRSLLNALARVDTRNEYLIFRNRETGADLIPTASNFHDRPLAVTAASRPRRIIYEQTMLVRETARAKVDVLLNAGVTAPLLCPTPMVTIVHDVQYRVHPRFARWFERPIWNTIFPLSAWRSRRLITLSSAAREEIEHFYPWSRGRVDIVAPGLDHDFEAVARRRDSEPATDPCILTVSTLHPHKNLDTLLRAFARAAAQRGDARLVICGLKGFETEKLLALRTELGLQGKVEFTGWIERAELLGHFARARAFVYPSRFEGFGIPVLEALTAGVPVICSDIPPLREIAGECATYVDPNDETGFTHAIERALATPAPLEEVIAGRARAKLFSWDAGAARLRDILESVTQG